MAAQNNLSPVEGKSPTGKECRQGPRFRVLLNAQLVTLADEQAVRVRDISTGGAMLEGQRPIAKAKDVLLRRGTIEIFGNILWTRGTECGLAFEEALSEAEMMAFVREPAKHASFVPEPFKTTPTAGANADPGRTAVEAFRSPIGRGVFGQ